MQIVPFATFNPCNAILRSPVLAPVHCNQMISSKGACLNAHIALEGQSWHSKSKCFDFVVVLQGRLRPAFARVLQALQAYAGILADDKGIKASRRLSAADLLACGEPHYLSIPDPKGSPDVIVISLDRSS